MNRKSLLDIVQITGMAFFSSTPKYDSESDFEFRRTDDGKSIEITGYIGSNKYVNIPPTIRGLPVTSIHKMDDKNWDRRITSITIPYSVTYIKEGAFSFLSSLTTIEVDINNNKLMSKDGVLYNKDKTILFKYPQDKIGSSFSIPNSVRSIGGYAFSDNYKLKNITIPNSVTSIGKEAFFSCYVTSINIPDGVTKIEKGTFSESGLKHVKIPDSVTTIGDRAFYFTGPVNIEYGPEYLTIPNRVTNIGEEAFHRCSFKSIKIPKSVTNIGKNAFSSCRKLTSVTFEGTIPSGGIDPSAFDKELYDKYLAGGPGLYEIHGGTWEKW